VQSPGLYLLHGASGDKEEWPAYDGAIDAEDRLILSRDPRPVIMVMPQGDQGYCVNWVNGGPRGGDYVSADLLSHVDANFRTLPESTHRAIGGLSMSGHGALQLGFNHPDLFHGIGAHSPSLHVDDGTFAPAGTGPDFDVREPLALAQIAPGIEVLDIAIDAGDQPLGGTRRGPSPDPRGASHQAQLRHPARRPRGHLLAAQPGGISSSTTRSSTRPAVSISSRRAGACVLYLSLIWLPLPGTQLRVPTSARGESTLSSRDSVIALSDRFGQTRAG
jgi:hypothetical protein